MANKTFVAKNGLTANTANVFMSEVATNLTAATILVKDSSHKMKLHTCKICNHKWVGDLGKIQCPKCSEKEIIIRNEQSRYKQN